MDTCVLNIIQDEGEYIFEGYCLEDIENNYIYKELDSLHRIFQVNQRAAFEFLISPITFAEYANNRDIFRNCYRIQWAMEVLDHWLTMLDEIGDRISDGGMVRHRFKLSVELQALEKN